MSYEPTCAICGHSVAPDSDHAAVEVERVRINDRNELKEFYLHERCADAVFGGWWEP